MWKICMEEGRVRRLLERREGAGKTHLLAGSREVDLGKLQNEKILSTPPDLCLVPERGGVVALCLVEGHVVGVDATYHETAAKVRGYPCWVVIAGVLDSKSIGVFSTATVDGKNHVVGRGRPEDEESRCQRERQRPEHIHAAPITLFSTHRISRGLRTARAL